MKLLIRSIVGFALAIAVLFIFFPPRACACQTKATAYRSMMKSDLRNLVTVEDSFRAHNRGYTTALTDLDYYKPAPGVHVQVLAASARGFIAEARHDLLPGWHCEIALQPFLRDGLHDGEPKCFED